MSLNDPVEGRKRRPKPLRYTKTMGRPTKYQTNAQNVNKTRERPRIYELGTIPKPRNPESLPKNKHLIETKRELEQVDPRQTLDR